MGPGYGKSKAGGSVREREWGLCGRHAVQSMGKNTLNARRPNNCVLLCLSLPAQSLFEAEFLVVLEAYGGRSGSSQGAIISSRILKLGGINL